jgi:chromosomal replication initiator protein
MKRLKRRGPDYDFDNSVIEKVCEYFEINRKDLESKSRKRVFVEPRQIVYYLLAKYSDSSIIVIARYFNRDHTTVIHGRCQIYDLMETDNVFRAEVMKVEELIKGDRKVRERVPVYYQS